jgi:thiamine-monophosphate kinase
MPGEREIIDIMNALLPQGRLNRSHESDCEVLNLNGKPCLFTTDEFSAEDRFIETNPRILGWNIAAGALSDIYACGGRPLYFAHALTVAKAWDRQFITGLGRGIADALRDSGALFIGGDCGRADEWRCTATVIGECAGRPLSRIGARPGDGIYITGRIGAGNVQAALGLVPLPRVSIPGLSGIQFPLRKKESELIRRFASACIDTSDGVWKTLSIIAELNECGYAVDSLPYHRAGALLSKVARLPSLLLFLGECGEYELLCTVPEAHDQEFQKEAKNAGLRFFRLGSITVGSRTVIENRIPFDLGSLDIEARSFASSRDYLAALTDWIDKQETAHGA